jgi:hypothetical protein
LCHLQHKLIGCYNRDEKCLQRGTDWGFKIKVFHSSLNMADFLRASPNSKLICYFISEMMLNASEHGLYNKYKLCRKYRKKVKTKSPGSCKIELSPQILQKVS